MQTKRPSVCLCSFKVYARRGQNFTMLVDCDMAKNEGGSFWSYFEAVLLQIAYIPLLLKCLISKSAIFLLCLLLHSLHPDYVLAIKY